MRQSTLYNEGSVLVHKGTPWNLSSGEPTEYTQGQ